MLKNYSPLLFKYNQLWSKYGNVPKNNQIISNQQDSIKWSLKLRDAISTLAKESNRKEEDLISLFISGAKASKDKRLLAGLQNLSLLEMGTCDDIINRFELFFDFNSLDDLFLDEDEEISVISIE